MLCGEHVLEGFATHSVPNALQIRSQAVVVGTGIMGETNSMLLMWELSIGVGYGDQVQVFLPLEGHA